jgi:hypothetical protein
MEQNIQDLHRDRGENKTYTSDGKAALIEGGRIADTATGNLDNPTPK